MRALIAPIALTALVLGACAAGPRAAEPKAQKIAAAKPASRIGTELPPLNARERELVMELRKDVEHLSVKIGERNAEKKWELADAADWLVSELEAVGYPVERQGWEVAGIAAQNLVVDVGGRIERDKIVLIGAHYDTAAGTPGADDNASGVAAVLALARRFRQTNPARTIRFAFFSLEEPPYFQTEQMGSAVYAKAAAARGETVLGMLSIESIGYYTQAAGSQRHPQAMRAQYPTRGDFLAVVGNPESRALVDGVVATMRQRGSLPVEGVALADDAGGLSDHWSFWQIGVSAVMLTDTAMFRNPHYHQPSDRPHTLDYERMARAVAGLEHVVAELGGVKRAGAGT